MVRNKIKILHLLTSLTLLINFILCSLETGVGRGDKSQEQRRRRQEEEGRGTVNFIFNYLVLIFMKLIYYLFIHPLLSVFSSELVVEGCNGQEDL